jgi:hypothetical protein
VSKKTKTENNKACCVRMPLDLFKEVEAEALEHERTPPAQIRLILKQHYGMAEAED